jgi:hypothetical protein
MLPFGVVQSDAAFARINDRLWCLLRLFLKYLEDHDGIIVNSINDPPGAFLIIDSQFMTSLPD